jgi:hypothetical protein
MSEIKKQFTPTVHSNTVGGSSAARVIACPASVALIQKMPVRDQEESTYAVEGTALHEAIEYCLFNGLEIADLPSLVGREFYGVPITEDLVRDALEPALRQFDMIYAELESEDGEVDYKLETRVHIPSIPDAFGTVDVTLTTPKRVMILDWKFGAGIPVTAFENKQLLFYALGASHTLADRFWGTVRQGSIKRAVELVIIQPRVFEEPSRWATTTHALYAFEGDLTDALVRAKLAKPPYERGEHCRFCPAAPICPMYADLAEQVQMLEQEMEELAQAEQPMVFTTDDMARWLVMADQIDMWTKAVRKLAMSEAEAGNPPTGKKLVHRLANTAWQRPLDEIERMLARRGLLVKDRRSTKLISPTAANKKLKALGKKMPEDSYGRSVAGVSLVDESDPRDAVMTVSERAAKLADLASTAAAEME